MSIGDGVMPGVDVTMSCRPVLTQALFVVKAEWPPTWKTFKRQGI